MKSYFEEIGKWLSWIILAAIMVCGIMVIMHDPSYELSDDTMIQTRIGIGEMHRVNEGPVFIPEEGRFFPLGYQHFNLLLLFSPSGVCAKMVYAFESVLWCLYLLTFFFIAKLSLPKNVGGGWQYIIPLCAVIVVSQRTLQLFTVLWTCSTFAILFMALAMLVWYYYCRDRKLWQLGLLVFLVAYYTFCGETNVVVPFMIGFCALLNINQTGKRDMRVVYSMSAIVVLFVALYLILIYPYISVAYDPAHGDNVTFIGNMISTLLNQKLLFLTLGIFVWRLYKVFVKKDEFDMYSDTLLATAIAIVGSNLVLKLNYPNYYIGAVLLSIPAYMQVLDFESKTRKIISVGAVMLITMYFLPKYYRLVHAIWDNRTVIYKGMQGFDEACINSENIVWYTNDPDGSCIQDKWARRHVMNHLLYLRHQPMLECFDASLNMSEFLLVIPESHTVEDVLSHINVPQSAIVGEGDAPSIKYYYVSR